MDSKSMTIRLQTAIKKNPAWVCQLPRYKRANSIDQAVFDLNLYFYKDRFIAK